LRLEDEGEEVVVPGLMRGAAPKAGPGKRSEAWVNTKLELATAAPLLAFAFLSPFEVYRLATYAFCEALVTIID